MDGLIPVHIKLAHLGCCSHEVCCGPTRRSRQSLLRPGHGPLLSGQAGRIRRGRRLPRHSAERASEACEAVRHEHLSALRLVALADESGARAAPARLADHGRAVDVRRRDRADPGLPRLSGPRLCHPRAVLSVKSSLTCRRERCIALVSNILDRVLACPTLTSLTCLARGNCTYGPRGSLPR